MPTTRIDDAVPRVPCVAAIANDGQEPRPRITIAKVVEGLDGAKDGILSHILRVVLVAQQIARQGMCVVQVRQYDVSELICVLLRHQRRVKGRGMPPGFKTVVRV